MRPHTHTRIPGGDCCSSAFRSRYRSNSCCIPVTKQQGGYKLPAAGAVGRDSVRHSRSQQRAAHERRWPRCCVSRVRLERGQERECPGGGEAEHMSAELRGKTKRSDHARRARLVRLPQLPQRWARPPVPSISVSERQTAGDCRHTDHCKTMCMGVRSGVCVNV